MYDIDNMDSDYRDSELFKEISKAETRYVIVADASGFDGMCDYQYSVGIQAVMDTCRNGLALECRSRDGKKTIVELNSRMQYVWEEV